MSQSSAESALFVNLWDITRYILVAVIAGILIWYCCFYTPVIYVSRETTGETMGTHYIVKVARFPETADWQKVVVSIRHRLETLDQMMSTYRQDSEICRFNAFSSTEDWFPVSKETAYAVQTALEISQLTEGAFDITVAPFVHLWGFSTGKHQAERSPMSFEELKSASVLLKKQISYEKLAVRFEPSALKKSIPELAIDLSALAKGLAVDSIAELLEEQKITDYMVEIGNTVRCKGKKDKRKDKHWIVGIEKPIVELSHQGQSNEFPGIQQKLFLEDKSLATNDNYRQTVQMGDQRVLHLVDPRTGLPVQIGNGTGELVVVTVITPNCSHADAWATAMFVLGEKEGLELANRHNIAVLLLLRNGDEVVEKSSKLWNSIKTLD